MSKNIYQYVQMSSVNDLYYVLKSTADLTADSDISGTNTMACIDSLNGGCLHIL